MHNCGYGLLYTIYGKCGGERVKLIFPIKNTTCSTGVSIMKTAFFKDALLTLVVHLGFLWKVVYLLCLEIVV